MAELRNLIVAGATSLSGNTTISGTLKINAPTGNYVEGIRIKASSENWATILLGGADLTAETGTSANSWGLFNNNGNFYISRNGSSTSSSAILSCVNNNWSLNNLSISNTSNSNAGLTVKSPSVTTSSGIPQTQDAKSTGMYNDAFAIRGAVNDGGWMRFFESSTSNDGSLEIATGDDGTEPIYCRQYNTSGGVVRTATLLDDSGNTSFPGYTTSNGVHITKTDDVELKTYDSDPLTIGTKNSYNLAIDTNEILARNGVNTSTLYLNANGGDIELGASVKVCKGRGNDTWGVETPWVYCTDWLRTEGKCGWYSQTYGGGWYMVDSSWVRTYNSKSVYSGGGTIRTDGRLECGDNGSTFKAINGDGVYINGNKIWVS